MQACSAYTNERKTSLRRCPGDLCVQRMRLRCFGRGARPWRYGTVDERHHL
jgi:hypothetical protein